MERKSEKVGAEQSGVVLIWFEFGRDYKGLLLLLLAAAYDRWAGSEIPLFSLRLFIS